MAKTIIQTIGPLYGEVVNGTVFGRPNGSIYIPASNTISSEIPAEWAYVRKFSTSLVLCTSTGPFTTDTRIKIVAESQDSQSYIGVSVEDSDGVTIGTPVSLSAGQFNVAVLYISSVSADSTPIVADEKYYIVSTLYSSNGVPVATVRKEVTGVVPQ